MITLTELTRYARQVVYTNDMIKFTSRSLLLNSIVSDINSNSLISKGIPSMCFRDHLTRMAHYVLYKDSYPDYIEKRLDYSPRTTIESFRKMPYDALSYFFDYSIRVLLPEWEPGIEGKFTSYFKSKVSLDANYQYNYSVCLPSLISGQHYFTGKGVIFRKLVDGSLECILLEMTKPEMIHGHLKFASNALDRETRETFLNDWETHIPDSESDQYTVFVKRGLEGPDARLIKYIIEKHVPTSVDIVYTEDVLERTQTSIDLDEMMPPSETLEEIAKTGEVVKSYLLELE